MNTFRVHYTVHHFFSVVIFKGREILRPYILNRACEFSEVNCLCGE